MVLCAAGLQAEVLKAAVEVNIERSECGGRAGEASVAAAVAYFLATIGRDLDLVQRNCWRTPLVCLFLPASPVCTHTRRVYVCTPESSLCVSRAQVFLPGVSLGVLNVYLRRRCFSVASHMFRCAFHVFLCASQMFVCIC